MPDILKTTLNTRSLLICLSVLITGISAGVFFGGIAPAADILNLTPLMQESKSQFFPSLLINLSFLLLILLAGFTVYGFPLVFIILFSRSFAVGFCDCLLLYSLDPGSILSFIFSFLLPQMLLCGVYLICSVVSAGYALSQIRK